MRHFRSSLLLGAAAVLLFVAGGILLLVAQEDESVLYDHALKVGDQEFMVAVADTTEEREQGLQYVTEMGEREGMLFIFDGETQQRTFWMKNTLIPLDFVWMRDGEVVHVTPDVPTEIGVEDAALTQYISAEPVNAMLELNAGTVENFGIQKTDKVIGLD